MALIDDILKLLPEGRNKTLPGDFPSQAGNTSSPGTQLVVSLSLGIFSILLFSVLRIKWPAIFSSRSRLKNSTPPKLGKSLFGWVLPLYKITEDEVLNLVGLDALMLIRFFKLGIKTFGILSFYGVFVLIPLTSLEYNSDKVFDINKIWMIVALPPGDNRLIAHCVGVYLVTIISIYFLNREYQVYSHLRWTYLKQCQKNISARTVIVEGIPKALLNQVYFKEYFESLEIGLIESTCLSLNSPKLSKIVRHRSAALRKLETNLASWLENPCVAEDYDVLNVQRSLDNGIIIKIGNKPRPLTRKGFFDSRIDAINYYYQIFRGYELAVYQLRNIILSDPDIKSRNDTDTGSGFVTFKSQKSAHMASQLNIHSTPFSLKTRLAPEPRDICWENINISEKEQMVRKIAVSILMLFVLFFWGVPLSFITPLLSLTQLVKVFPFLNDLKDISPVIWSLISGLLPTLLVIIFISMTPAIFTYLSMFQGEKSRSAIERLAVSKHFFFLLINLLLVFTITSTLWKQILNQVVKDPSEIANVLAKSLPTVAPFFINYTMLLGIGYFPFQLLQLGPVFTFTFLRMLSSTPRDIADLLVPVFTNYAWLYGQPMIIFVIVTIYSVISPLILVVGTIYFILGHYANKYCILYVYHRYYESGGLIWPVVFRRIIIGLFLLQITMAGMFVLLDSIPLTISMIPLIVITGIFVFYISRAYPNDCEFLPMDLIPAGGNSTIPELNDAFFSNCFDNAINQVQSHFSSITDATHFGVSQPTNCQDDYSNAAITNLRTDYSQSSMLRFNGVLDSSLHHYDHPALFGTLPYLWLPQKIDSKTYYSLKKQRTCYCCFPLSLNPNDEII